MKSSALLLALSLAIPLSAALLDSAQSGGLKLKSISSISFGKDGLLLVADPSSQSVIAMIRQPEGGAAKISRLDDWRIAMCPMSSISMNEVTGTLRVAWENDGRIVMGELGGDLEKLGPPAAKHPSLVTNGQGSTLIACITGSGWMKAGQLHWELRDAKGKITGTGEGGKLPVWSFAAAYALPDGSFGILR